PERHVRPLHLRDESLQRLSVEVFHHDERTCLVDPDFVGVDHVRMRETRGEACLVEEHGYELGIVGKLGTDLFDDEELANAGRTARYGEQYAGHPALAERGNRPVPALTPRRCFSARHRGLRALASGRCSWQGRRAPPWSRSRWVCSW